MEKVRGRGRKKRERMWRKRKKHLKAKEETKLKNISIEIMSGGWGSELGERGDARVW
jgi:hypothetical protein